MKKAHRYNIGLVGNCNYLAYIRDDSSVCWMCWPMMDSSFVFGALLDEKRGGEFKIVPEKLISTKQRYLENTAILVTSFYCEDGEFDVIDFAPRFYVYHRYHKPLQFFRKIKRVSGHPRIKVLCEPRGDYGSLVPEIHVGSNHITYNGLHVPIRLTTNATKTYLIEQRSFLLSEDLYFLISEGEQFSAPIRETFEEFFYKTKDYWRRWVKETFIPNTFQKELIRSSITIKLHQYEDTGAIIASGTTSLPEYPGSGRNWDYRYCWLRDSYFSLAALNSVGHFEEVERYLHFIHNILGDLNQLQPMYRINGESSIEEKIVELDGFMDNRPVRIGNAAYYQKQFDSYGQVILSLLPLYTDERIIHLEQVVDKSLIVDLLISIERVMDLPDAGTWELRGREEKHLGTYIFHWAGAKAGYKIGEYYQDEELKTLAQKIIELSELNIEKCYDPETKSYMADQTLSHYDATGFLLINMNYLDPEDPKTRDFFETLRAELLSPEGMIYRYRRHDDFGDTHATFLICTYWFIEALICLGELDEAHESLENIIKHANHLGLLSEDLSSEDGGQWGNFPQTYSHVGLINAVCRLARKKDRMVYEF